VIGGSSPRPAGRGRASVIDRGVGRVPNRIARPQDRNSKMNGNAVNNVPVPGAREMRLDPGLPHVSVAARCPSTEVRRIERSGTNAPARRRDPAEPIRGRRSRMASAWTTTHERTWPGYVLALGTASAERFDPQDALGERLRRVLVDGGGGLVQRGGRAFPFHCPAAFCLDEREQVSFQGADLRYRLLYFHPSVLHRELTFETIRGGPRGALPVSTSGSRSRPWRGGSRPTGPRCRSGSRR
jgi:hypothetical protein